MTETQLLSIDAFNRLVLEEKLPTWETGGYTYTGKKGPDGYEIYRTYGPKWAYLYQARRVATQTNAAGGAVIIDITIATGKMAKLVQLYAANSGTNTLRGNIGDEDNAMVAQTALVGSAATLTYGLPSIGSAASSSGNLTDTNGMLIGPGQKLTVYQSAAGVQNDTLTAAVVLLLPIDAVLSDISWSTARSTNPGNVTLAANTISAANEWQAVLLP